MDTTAGTKGGDRARAAFGHLVPTAPEEPRRGARVSRVAFAQTTATVAASPEARPAAAPHRTLPVQAPLPVEASMAETTVHPTARKPSASGLLAFATPSARRYAIMAAVALLLSVPLARKLGLFAASEPLADRAAAASLAAAPDAAASIASERPRTARASAAAPAHAETPRTRRRSDTVIDVASGDARMTAARDRALAGLATFWQHAEAPRAGEGDFALKVALTTRAGSLEHIWSAVESRNGDAIVVRISNDPVDIANVRLGSVLTVREAQISDWMFRRNGRIVGAESLRVLVETMPPAEAARYRAMLEAR